MSSKKQEKSEVWNYFQEVEEGVLVCQVVEDGGSQQCNQKFSMNCASKDLGNTIFS